MRDRVLGAKENGRAKFIDSFRQVVLIQMRNTMLLVLSSRQRILALGDPGRAPRRDQARCNKQGPATPADD
jgi:hypothetical protein